MAFGACAFVTSFQLHFQLISPENRFTTFLAICIIVLSGVVQAYQLVVPVLNRLKSKDYKGDAHPMFRVKMYGTMISIVTSAYDLWNCIEDNYYKFLWRKLYMGMTAITLSCALLTFLTRAIGPERLYETRVSISNFFEGIIDPIKNICCGTVSWRNSLTERMKLLLICQQAGTNGSGTSTV